MSNAAVNMAMQISRGDLVFTSLAYILRNGISVSYDQESACIAGDPGSISGLGQFPGEKMTTHSIFFAWRIPWTEEPRRLEYMGSQESDMT